MQTINDNFEVELNIFSFCTFICLKKKELSIIKKMFTDIVLSLFSFKVTIAKKSWIQTLFTTFLVRSNIIIHILIHWSVYDVTKTHIMFFESTVYLKSNAEGNTITYKQVE